jgi:hypothetical protein
MVIMKLMTKVKFMWWLMITLIRRTRFTGGFGSRNPDIMGVVAIFVELALMIAK